MILRRFYARLERKSLNWTLALRWPVSSALSGDGYYCRISLKYSNPKLMAVCYSDFMLITL